MIRELKNRMSTMLIPAFLRLHLATTNLGGMCYLLTVVSVCELKEIFLELYTLVYLYLKSRIPDL